MKVLSIILILSGISIACSGQIVMRDEVEQTNVPSAILEKFNTDKPDGKIIRWFKIGGLSYQAEYTEKGEQFLRTYSLVSNETQTKRLIKLKEVPKQIRRRLKKDFGDVSFDTIYELLDDNESNYEFEGDRSGERIMLRL